MLSLGVGLVGGVRLHLLDVTGLALGSKLLVGGLVGSGESAPELSKLAHDLGVLQLGVLGDDLRALDLVEALAKMSRGGNIQQASHHV